MHANMQDLELLRTCVETLCNLLNRVPLYFRDAEDASNDNDVMNISALMHAGVHNVLNLLIRAMREHMDDYEFQQDASHLFELFTRIMDILINRTCMEDFVMHEAEAVLIASMHRHSHQTEELNTASWSDFSVQENCIVALQGLMKFDFESMRHIRGAMQATINAAVQHSGDFMDHMLNMFGEIMRALATSPLETERMQTFVANSAMVHIYIMHILNDEWVRGKNDEDDTRMAFKMLISICKDNATTSAQMLQADVVRTIDSASASLTSKSAHWHKTQEYLVEILDT